MERKVNSEYIDNDGHVYRLVGGVDRKIALGGGADIAPPSLLSRLGRHPLIILACGLATIGAVGYGGISTWFILAGILKMAFQLDSGSALLAGAFAELVCLVIGGAAVALTWDLFNINHR